jgi:hypothetical protein
MSDKFWSVTEAVRNPTRENGALRNPSGGAGTDYIGLYGGDAKLLSESLEYVQRSATRILNAIDADPRSAPPS